MNRRALFPAVLSLLLITQSLFAASNEVPHKPFPPAWQATLDLFPAPVRPTGEGLVPGAVVIIKSPAFGVRVGVTGYADIPAKKAMSPDFHFRVGSVTKSFTAQIVLMLEQQGKLKLTDLITKYLGDDPTVMAIPGIGLVTIGEALQMNSGIANYLGDPMISASPDVTPDRHYSPDELMAVLAVNRNPLQMLPPNPPPPPSPPVSCPPPPPSPPNPNPPMFTPPTATYPNPYWQSLTPSAPQPPPFASWFYSNSNYILLGMIIQHAFFWPRKQQQEQRMTGSPLPV
jgi:CubicO group peptidase (beta-lactamase class C family)